MGSRAGIEKLEKTEDALCSIALCCALSCCIFLSKIWKEKKKKYVRSTEKLEGLTLQTELENLLGCLPTCLSANTHCT